MIEVGESLLTCHEPSDSINQNIVNVIEMPLKELLVNAESLKLLHNSINEVLEIQHISLR